jgi:TRAP-type mannitol/chloroaromatic compound transport system substrate-binding protein
MKKEDLKLSLINERKKHLVNDMVNESENEIKKIVGDKNYYNTGNYDMINEMNIFKKKKNMNNLSDSSFPIINVNNSKNFLSTTHKLPRKNISEIKDLKQRQITLYKRDKLKEIKKKKEENEQLVLRDIHRKIKAIYDSFKYK